MKKLAVHLGPFSIIVLAILVIWGYVANLVKLLMSDGFAVLEIVRCIGLVIPFLGSVMGFVG